MAVYPNNMSDVRRWLERSRRPGQSWLLVLLAALLVAGCNIGASPTDVPADEDAATELADVTPEPGSLNLLATILAMEDLSMLGSALVAADLAPELESDTAYTVLAPTNDAFEALPPGVLDALLADPATLAEVLRYHLIVGAATGAELAPLGTAQTVQGETVALALTQDAALVVNNAQVIEGDIAAANGMIHKVDTVLLPTTAQALLLPTPTVEAAAETVTGTTEMTATGAITTEAGVTGEGDVTGAAPLLATPVPAAGTGQPLTGTGATTETAAITGTTPTTAVVVVTGTTPISPVSILTSTAPAGQTIMDVLADRDDLSTIAGGLTAGGLAVALTEPGPFTFFAPTNDAFERAGAAEVEALLNDIPRLARTLQYHIVADRVTAQDLARLGSALTTMGQTIDITVDESGQVLANGAPLRESIETANGIIHLVDGILIPAAE